MAGVPFGREEGCCGAGLSQGRSALGSASALLCDLDLDHPAPSLGNKRGAGGEPSIQSRERWAGWGWHLEAGSPLLWGVRGWQEPGPSSGASWELWGPGLQLIGHWEGCVSVLTFGGRPQHQAQHPQTSGLLSDWPGERLCGEKQGWGEAVKSPARTWESEDLASSPSSAPGPGDLGLDPAPLLTSFPKCERRWVKLVVPSTGSLLSLTFPGPVSVEKGRGGLGCGRTEVSPERTCRIIKICT